MSLIVAEIFGILASDRIPLWASRRLSKGIWHPEYRLWNLLLPGLLAPIGLGIFGAGLEYHYHYMVLAFGTFLVTFSSVLSLPIVVNYVVECFVHSAAEVAVIMNVYRLALGLALPFFIDGGWQRLAVWYGGIFLTLHCTSGSLAGLERQDASSFHDKRNHRDRGRREYMCRLRDQSSLFESRFA